MGSYTVCLIPTKAGYKFIILDDSLGGILPDNVVWNASCWADNPTLAEQIVLSKLYAELIETTDALRKINEIVAVLI